MCELLLSHHVAAQHERCSTFSSDRLAALSDMHSTSDSRRPVPSRSSSSAAQSLFQDGVIAILNALDVRDSNHAAHTCRAWHHASNQPGREIAIAHPLSAGDLSRLVASPLFAHIVSASLEKVSRAEFARICVNSGPPWGRLRRGP